ncbi:hypothetical protein PFISCL1PPCAC_19234, partial [Pristionchus fissidentatus]
QIEQLEGEAVAREAKIAKLERGQKASTSVLKTKICIKNSVKPPKCPTAIHLMQLPNGKRVMINMYFDIEKWTLCDVDHIDSLEDLCFVFDSNNDEKSTQFVMRIGESRYEWFDYQKISARFRVGPILSNFIGEKEVLWHCQSKPNTVKSIDTIEVSIQLRANNRSSYGVCRSYIGICGRKGLETETLKEGKTSKVISFFSQEILSLHSPYFLNIFYGDFCERKQDIIRIPGISLLTLRRATLYSSRFDLKTELFIDLLHFFDQFSFVDSLNRLKIEAAQRALELPRIHWRLALEIIDVLQNEATLRKFFDRFVTTDCLNELMKQHVDVMSRETTMHLTQRMAEIATINHRRPKIRFVFSEGEVIVSLFNDIRPRTIDNFISLIRNHGIGLFRNSTVTQSADIKYTYLPYMTASLYQPDEEKQPITILSQPIRLYYLNNCLFFKESLLSCSNLGTVVSGAEIVPNVTVLTSIAL